MILTLASLNTLHVTYCVCSSKASVCKTGNYVMYNVMWCNVENGIQPVGSRRAQRRSNIRKFTSHDHMRKLHYKYLYAFELKAHIAHINVHKSEPVPGLLQCRPVKLLLEDFAIYIMDQPLSPLSILLPYTKDSC